MECPVLVDKLKSSNWTETTMIERLHSALLTSSNNNSAQAPPPPPPGDEGGAVPEASSVPSPPFVPSCDPKRTFGTESFCCEDCHLRPLKFGAEDQPESITPIHLLKDMDNVRFIGISAPKSGTNKLKQIIPRQFGVTSCTQIFPNGTQLFPDSTPIQRAVSCSGGAMRPADVRKGAFETLSEGKCAFLISHGDSSQLTLPWTVDVKLVTILRQPIARVVSACNYAGVGLTDILAGASNFALAYGGPDHATKLIAGNSPICSLTPLDPNPDDKDAQLAVAKYNLKHNIAWFAILERLDDSYSLLYGHNRTDEYNQDATTVLPHDPGAGGGYVDKAWKYNMPACKKVEISHAIELDVDLYEYAIDLMDERLAALGMQPAKSREQDKRVKAAYFDLQRCLHAEHPWKKMRYVSFRSRVDCAGVPMGSIVMPAQAGIERKEMECPVLVDKLKSSNWTETTMIERLHSALLTS
jgi:hypothetical protein